VIGPEARRAVSRPRGRFCVSDRDGSGLTVDEKRQGLLAAVLPRFPALVLLGILTGAIWMQTLGGESCCRGDGKFCHPAKALESCCCGASSDNRMDCCVRIAADGAWITPQLEVRIQPPAPARSPWEATDSKALRGSNGAEWHFALAPDPPPPQRRTVLAWLQLRLI